MKGGIILKNVLPLLLFFISINVSAQDHRSSTAKSVVEDGIADEWVSSQIQYNSSTKLSYAITNDGSNLHLLIKSADQPTSSKILANSLRISINSRGNKKAKTSVTFPLLDRDALLRTRQFRASRDERPASSGANARNELLAEANNVKVEGFPRIPDGTFSVHLVNTYGIKAAARFDENKVLVYELSIPLSQMDISPVQAKAIACQIKINGSSDPADDPSRYSDTRRVPGGNGGIPTGGGGMIPGIGTRGIPGMGGTIRVGSNQRPQSRPVNNYERDKFNTKSAAFWVKYSLAKTKL